ncbi:MAG: NADH-ubiquinone oxidoreductase-F iron-sulfur binding region domain-containing protein [Acidimicrobiales bacterium]
MAQSSLHPVFNLAEYTSTGGLSGLVAAQTRTANETLSIIANAGLRGRGGAGFPTARKWAGVIEGTSADDEAFVVVNAAEGEPGTFKDRALLDANPYLVLEGAMIAALCIQAQRIVIATKSTYTSQLAAIRRAIEELRAVGWLDGLDVVVVEGPDHYLFGEETALLEVIEGNEPLPRQIPPYLYGLYTTGPQLGWSAGIDDSPGGPAVASSNPALVNNAETLAHVALVCRNGAEWCRQLGTTGSPGPTIVTITGDVRRAVVAEIELGTPLNTLIEELAGGPNPGRSVKAVLSGVSNAALTADALEAPTSYEGLSEAGGGLGSAGFIVYDDSRNMVDVAYQVSRFLHIESCGQCNSCKLGTHEVTVILEQLVRGEQPRVDAVANLRRYLQSVNDSARCYLPTQEQVLIPSLLDRFPTDLAQRLDGQPGDLDVPLPHIVDISNGTAVLADGPPHKHPDWTTHETPVRFSTT